MPEPVFDAVLQDRLEKEPGDDHSPAGGIHLRTAGQPVSKPGELDLQVLVDIFHILGKGHFSPASAYAVAQDLCQLPDQFTGLFRIKVDQVPDDLQGVIEKMRIHLGGKLIHFKTGVEPDKLRILAVEHVDRVHHPVDLHAHLAELIFTIDPDPVVRILRPDDPELLNQGVDGGRVPFRHVSGHSVGQLPPDIAHQEHDQDSQKEIAVPGGIDQGINDRGSVLNLGGHDPVPVLVDVADAVHGLGLFEVFLSPVFVHAGHQAVFAGIHDIVAKICHHTVKVPL